MSKSILTIVGLLSLAAFTNNTHASEFTTKDELIHSSVTYDPVEANRCIKTLTTIYPRLILLAHWPLFKATSPGMITMHVIYAIDMGYGFQRGPFEGFYVVIWHDNAPVSKIFYNAQTFINPFTGQNPL